MADRQSMILIDITYPAGTLDADDHALLAAEFERRHTGLAGDEHPTETLDRARTLTHLAFGERAGWYTGDGLWRGGDTDAPVLWVTFTVAEAWIAEGIAAPYIAMMRHAVHHVDRSHGWTRADGTLWINVVGVPDGQMGLNGKPSGADDLLTYLTEGFRSKLASGDVADAPDGKVLDPTCGMYVNLTPNTLTLEYSGTTFGFCCAGCRDRFAGEHDLDIPA